MRPFPKGSYAQPSGYAVVQSCSDEKPNLSQMFVMTKHGVVMTDESVCLDASDKDTQNIRPKVKIIACNGQDRQIWRYNEIVSVNTNEFGERDKITFFTDERICTLIDRHVFGNLAR